MLRLPSGKCIHKTRCANMYWNLRYICQMYVYKIYEYSDNASGFIHTQQHTHADTRTLKHLDICWYYSDISNDEVLNTNDRIASFWAVSIYTRQHPFAHPHAHLYMHRYTHGVMCSNQIQLRFVYGSIYNSVFVRLNTACMLASPLDTTEYKWVSIEFIFWYDVNKINFVHTYLLLSDSLLHMQTLHYSI